MSKKKRAPADMVVIHACCAGLDVHKKTVVACVRRMEPDGTVFKQTREFPTTTRSILSMADWMASEGVTHVVMESTGVFWKPIWNLLEEPFELMLCNAQHVKQVPGRKTDVKDSEWLAQLLQYGLLRGSFVPPQRQRDLRELTRCRAQLVADLARVANRLHKTLEDANIKLGSVATDILGVSGRDMLEALIRGEDAPEVLAGFARRRLRAKIPELRLAFEGRVREHHRFLLASSYEQIKHIECQIALLDARIVVVMEDSAPPSEGQDTFQHEPLDKATGAHQPSAAANAPTNPSDDESNAGCAQASPQSVQPLSFQQAIELLDEIPGIDRLTAENILVEIGTDMSQFPTAHHAASWAGISPGNNESAGKRKTGKTNKGNRWLRRAINQAAWAASHTKNTYLAAFYKRIALRRGKKRAIVALGHTLLVIIYTMLKTHNRYSDLGADYFDNINPDAAARYHRKRLEKLGYVVSMEKPDAVA
jgi:transposase